MTKVLRIAAFSDGNRGGNPAGVWIGDALPDTAAMQAIAAEVGFSETAFAAPEREAWRVRYFSPAMEVPFCGHATIALGAALAHRFGDRSFALHLNDAVISVSGHAAGGVVEDPATGAAAAAFAGYLRDIGWPHGGTIDIVQGEDMGVRSLIRAEIGAAKGSSIRVSGTARFIDG